MYVHMCIVCRTNVKWHGCLLCRLFQDTPSSTWSQGTYTSGPALAVQRGLPILISTYPCKGYFQPVSSRFQAGTREPFNVHATPSREAPLHSDRTYLNVSKGAGDMVTLALVDLVACSKHSRFEDNSMYGLVNRSSRTFIFSILSTSTFSNFGWAISGIVISPIVIICDTICVGKQYCNQPWWWWRTNPSPGQDTGGEWHPYVHACTLLAPAHC